ncbi:MAG: DDE-type integrase/transposase/recombinase, partial [Proteobacteria bacterium]|nr:DDE-type integrase/transposase/recombinase [Pseudomonadota bacterium]
WAQVGIDIMSMKEVDGFKYLITAMDYFSKNMEMRAMRNKSAKEVALFIYEEVICRWGSPDVIITDQGREFCNNINDALMERAHCRHRITSSYHPQSNGLVERQNRTTTQFLLKNMDCQDDWVKMIPTMMASHRHTVHTSTNIEPSAILLGRRPTLATDMKLKSDEYFTQELQDYEIENIENTDYNKVLSSFNFIKGNMYDYASNNISAAQSKMKKYYDIRHSHKFAFKEGDSVLKILCKNIGRKGGKKEPKFSGPYTIEHISDLGVATLKTQRGCVMKRGVPVKQLQKYNQPINAIESEERMKEEESDDSENIKPVLKRRRLFPDGDDSSDIEHVTGEDIVDRESVKTATLKVPSVYSCFMTFHGVSDSK